MLPYVNFAGQGPVLQQPGMSTMAAGEEGGGFTTLALGENGGTMPPATAFVQAGGYAAAGNNNVSQNTLDYIRFLQSADARGTQDGQLTRTEAQNQLQQYQKQLSTTNTLAMLFSLINPASGALFTGHLQNLNTMIGVGNNILQNFSVLATGNDRNSGSITERDIWGVTPWDLNPGTLSSRDLLYQRLWNFFNSGGTQQQEPAPAPAPAPVQRKETIFDKFRDVMKKRRGKGRKKVG